MRGRECALGHGRVAPAGRTLPKGEACVAPQTGEQSLSGAVQQRALCRVALFQGGAWRLVCAKVCASAVRSYAREYQGTLLLWTWSAPQSRSPARPGGDVISNSSFDVSVLILCDAVGGEAASGPCRWVCFIQSAGAC